MFLPICARVLWRYSLVFLFGMFVLLARPVQATEHGMGMYLLGSKGPLAGVVPSPGWYFQNDLYYYRARAGAATKLPMGGKIGVGIRARALIDVPTLIWSPDTKILNAQPAFSLSQPIGRETVEDRKSTRLNSSHVAISYAVS